MVLILLHVGFETFQSYSETYKSGRQGGNTEKTTKATGSGSVTHFEEVRRLPATFG